MSDVKKGKAGLSISLSHVPSSTPFFRIVTDLQICVSNDKQQQQRQQVPVVPGTSYHKEVLIYQRLLFVLHICLYIL